jgi:hypothetical protein
MACDAQFTTCAQRQAFVSLAHDVTLNSRRQRQLTHANVGMLGKGEISLCALMASVAMSGS